MEKGCRTAPAHTWLHRLAKAGTTTLCQSRLYPQSGTKNLASDVADFGFAV
jgi:hypothetical protein